MNFLEIATILKRTVSLPPIVEELATETSVVSLPKILRLPPGFENILLSPIGAPRVSEPVSVSPTPQLQRKSKKKQPIKNI